MLIFLSLPKTKISIILYRKKLTTQDHRCFIKSGGYFCFESKPRSITGSFPNNLVKTESNLGTEEAR